MPYHVTFYSPDRHLQYDGRIPRERGIGGGITSRIRMAEALAAAGHHVEMVVNCEEAHRCRQVHYRPLDSVARLDADILLLNTSGDQLDLSPAQALNPRARLKIVWISGTIMPGGLESIGFDFVYAKSNFLRQVAVDEWGVPRDQLFVAYNVFPEELFAQAERNPPLRDPYRLVYFAHPSKGLDTAMDVLQRLHADERRFRLAVYGGNQLWGQAEAEFIPPPGVDYKGLVGQSALMGELLAAGYALNLQNRPEPFGLTLIEAMRAGCIALASSVGAYPEIIHNGWDGFILSGDTQEPTTRARAANLILEIGRHDHFADLVRSNAAQIPWAPERMVRTWEQHWEAELDRQAKEPARQPEGLQVCPVCQGRLGLYPDGYRCDRCARYYRALPGLA